HQHCEPGAGSIPEAALPFADRTHPAQFHPEGVSILRTIPDAELRTLVSQHFVTSITSPLQKGIISEHESFIAHTRDTNQDRARLESSTKPGFALGKSRLPSLTFNA